MALSKTAQKLIPLLDNPYVRAMLDTIAEAEVGQDAFGEDRGYRSRFGYGKLDSLDTHPGWAAAGTYKAKSTGQKKQSTAAGRYQYLLPTWQDMQKRHGFSDFSERSQDLMALVKLHERGALEPLLKGDFDGALAMAGKEWQALPGTTLGGADANPVKYEQVLNTYNRALAQYTGGSVEPYRPQTPPQAANKPVAQAKVPSAGRSAAPRGAGGGTVRDILNRRYQRPHLAIAAAPLTPETMTNLEDALRNPNYGRNPDMPGVATGIALANGQAAPLLQPALDANGNPIGRKSVAGPVLGPGYDVSGNPVGPLVVGEANVPTPMATPAPSEAHEFTPQWNLAAPNAVPVSSNSRVTVTPLQETTAVAANTPPEVTVSYDTAVADLLGIPQTAPDYGPAMTPEQYLEQSLAKLKPSRGAEDFLQVAALTGPFHQELADLFDSTAVTLG